MKKIALLVVLSLVVVIVAAFISCNNQYIAEAPTEQISDVEMMSVKKTVKISEPCPISKIAMPDTCLPNIPQFNK